MLVAQRCMYNCLLHYPNHHRHFLFYCIGAGEALDKIAFDSCAGRRRGKHKSKCSQKSLPSLRIPWRHPRSPKRVLPGVCQVRNAHCESGGAGGSNIYYRPTLKKCTSPCAVGWRQGVPGKYFSKVFGQICRNCMAHMFCLTHCWRLSTCWACSQGTFRADIKVMLDDSGEASSYSIFLVWSMRSLTELSDWFQFVWLFSLWRVCGG